MPRDPGWPTEADYAWAEGRDAFCVSFVEAMSPEAVLEKMVGGCGTGIVTAAEAREWVSDQTELDYGSAIEPGMGGGWVVTVEANGYQATLPEVVRAISKGSRAIVVFGNIHAHTRFLYAVDGVVVRSFDPLLYDDPTPWDGPPLPEESGLDFGSAAIRWLQHSHAPSASRASASHRTCWTSTATVSPLATTPCIP